MLYTVVSQQGEEELARPTSSLFWSGVSAGFAICASVVAEGALHEKLPDQPWRPLVADIGYTVGFLIVILGRMQLFTEQTVVPVLTAAREFSWTILRRLMRLWGIVFAANMIGVCVVAAATAAGGLTSTDLREAMIEISLPLLESDFTHTLLRGIPAGFLIASIAWMLAATKEQQFPIILTLTYVIAVGEFSHVVAGAAEAFLLAFSGEATLLWALGGFILPAAIGNVIGGTCLFALFAYAQVRREI